MAIQLVRWKSNQPPSQRPKFWPQAFTLVRGFHKQRYSCSLSSYLSIKEVQINSTSGMPTDVSATFLLNRYITSWLELPGHNLF